MKKYQILELQNKELCTPSEDYYARQGDWSSDNFLIFFKLGEPADTEQEAIDELKHLSKGSYIILPVYINS